MVVVVTPFMVTDTSLTTVLALDAPPLDPPLPLAADDEAAGEEEVPVVCDDPVVCEDVVEDEDWDDAGVVADDAIDEIDMESSRKGDIDKGSAGSRSAHPLNARTVRNRRRNPSWISVP